MLMLIPAALIIAVAQSTKEGRAAARAALKPFTRRLWPVAIVLWLLILEPWRWIPG